MNKTSTVSPDYFEFREKCANKLSELSKVAGKRHMSVEEAEGLFNFKVKEIHSFVERKDIDEEYIPYMNERLCRTLVLGAALPTLSGWILAGYPYTIFVAYGFNNEYMIFSLTNSNIDIDALDIDKIEKEYLSLSVEYTEELATLFETTNPDKKPPIKH